MRSVISRLNVGYYEKLLANETDNDKRQILQRLLSDEKNKLALSLKKQRKRPTEFIHDLSRVSVQGCHQESTKDAILELRRGPIFHPRKHSIFLQGDRADHIIVVINGVVRTCRYDKAGKRSVVGFYFDGDTLGWNDDTLRSLTAEAATDCTLLYLKRSSLMTLAAQNLQVSDFVLSATKTELRRTLEYSLLISKDAKSRVAAFLFDLWDRTGRRASLRVPMKYQDIADHLGLTLECVSRTISSLARAGIFGRQSCRELTMKDRSSLERAANYSWASFFTCLGTMDLWSQAMPGARLLWMIS